MASPTAPAESRRGRPGHRLTVLRSERLTPHLVRVVLGGPGVDDLAVQEQVAIQLGIDAEQMMLPIDHLFLDQAKMGPALMVIRHPSGGTHFVVIWRQVGGWLRRDRM